MSTAPQPPVSVTPPLKNRRNAELLLVFFAAAITAIAVRRIGTGKELPSGRYRFDVEAGLTHSTDDGR